MTSFEYKGRKVEVSEYDEHHFVLKIDKMVYGPYVRCWKTPVTKARQLIDAEEAQKPCYHLPYRTRFNDREYEHEDEHERYQEGAI